MVTILEALVLGALQGVLEWLPVSSSGQLSVVMLGALGVEAVEAYRASLALHLGTALASALWFRRRLLEAVRRGLGDPLTRLLLVGTLVSLLVAAPLELLVEEHLHGVSLEPLMMLIGSPLCLGSRGAGSP